MERRAWGWKKDLPDIRDETFTSFRLRGDYKDLPIKVDLRPSFPAPYDQSTLGSCTAQAVGAICDYRYGLPAAFSPSALFLYYVTRSLEGTVHVDSGASIRNTIKAVNKYGICTETIWPYDIQVFKTQPVSQAYADGEEHQALQYRNVRQRLDDLRAALASDCPIAFGFSVYESFEELNSRDYIIKYPGTNEQMLGGHAVVIVGYDDELQCFIIRNSWGTSFGDQGHFLMPYSFILNRNLCSDFWTIELMEELISERIAK